MEEVLVSIVDITDIKPLTKVFVTIIQFYYYYLFSTTYCSLQGLLCDLG